MAALSAPPLDFLPLSLVVGRAHAGAHEHLVVHREPEPEAKVITGIHAVTGSVASMFLLRRTALCVQLRMTLGLRDRSEMTQQVGVGETPPIGRSGSWLGGRACRRALRLTERLLRSLRSGSAVSRNVPPS